ncbi:MAG TPA: hypothetical protein VH561_14080 [Micromonosporaceae bacterium]|jgi:hypothetical protein
MNDAVIVRYQTTVDAAEENQRAVERVYAELAQTAPAGLRYLTLRLADGVTFVHIAIRDAQDNPLNRSAAFAEFQRGLPQRQAEPPLPTPATLVGLYGF